MLIFYKMYVNIMITLLNLYIYIQIRSLSRRSLTRPFGYCSTMPHLLCLGLLPARVRIDLSARPPVRPSSTPLGSNALAT